MDPSLLTIGQARTAIARGALSTHELAEAVLARAEALNPELNAYFELDPEAALTQAAAADRVQAEAPGPLHGIPISVKAIIDVEAVATTAGASHWRRMPDGDAVVVRRLRAAGATLLTRGHTNEFAYGIDGRNPHWGDAHNPHDSTRLAGGSSSGAAVATAAGLALAGLGSDTSGSSRVPPALCGVVGVRPTPGAIPADGIVPLAPSYDVPGPIARTVEDARTLLEVLAARPVPVISSLAGLRIGLLEDLLELAAPYMATGIEACRRALEAAGARIESARLGPPGTLAAIAQIHRTISYVEAARVHAPWFATEREHYSEPVRARLELGRAIGNAEYYAALADRGRIARAARPPVLLAPTTCEVAPPIDIPDAQTRDLLLGCVVPTTQLASPIVAVPAGWHDGLPYGLQVIAPPGEEALALAVAERCETACPPRVSSVQAPR